MLLEMTRATIAYLGASLVVRRSAVRQEPKLYEAMLKGTLDAMRFFMKPENKSASMKSIARVLRLQRWRTRRTVTTPWSQPTTST